MSADKSKVLTTIPANQKIFLQLSANRHRQVLPVLVKLKKTKIDFTRGRDNFYRKFLFLFSYQDVVFQLYALLHETVYLFFQQPKYQILLELPLRHQNHAAGYLKQKKGTRFNHKAKSSFLGGKCFFTPGWKTTQFACYLPSNSSLFYSVSSGHIKTFKKNIS